MPNKVVVIQRFENPYLRPGEFTIKISGGRTGQLSVLSPDLLQAMQPLVDQHNESSGPVDPRLRATWDMLKNKPSDLNWRWFRFKRKIYHPLLGGKKTLITALTCFDFTEMAFPRGRRGHQMAGFFHEKVFSVNRPPSRKEWVEAKIEGYIREYGVEPSPAEVKQFKRLFRARPPLGPEKQRWITLLWVPTDTIQGAAEIRQKIDIVANAGVLTSQLLMKEGPKIAHYDHMKAQNENVLAWRRDIERAVHASNVSLMQESHRRMELQQQSAMEGLPRRIPPVMHEFPQMPGTAVQEKRLGIPTMPDWGKFAPLLAMIVGVFLLCAGAWTWTQTADMPTRSGADIATLGGVFLALGMIMAWLQSRGQTSTRRPLQPHAPQYPAEGRAPVVEEKEPASESS